MSWSGIKKIIILKCRLHLFYTTTTNHFSIGLWYVIDRGFHDDQLSDRTERSSKVLPKAKFVPPKKGHGHCLVVCCWSDPLQLPESWQNHYIWEVYSANQGDALKTAMPAAGTGHQKVANSAQQHLTTHHTTNASQVEWTGLQSFASSTISPDLSPTHYHFFKHLYNFFAGKMLPQPSGGRK